MIERCTSLGQAGWLNLREALWPHCSREEHFAEMGSFLAEPTKYIQFVAYSEAGVPIGFVEASVRTEYVNGTNTAPIAFLKDFMSFQRRAATGQEEPLSLRLRNGPYKLVAVNSPLTLQSTTCSAKRFTRRWVSKKQSAWFSFGVRYRESHPHGACPVCAVHLTSVGFAGGNSFVRRQLAVVV